MSTENWHYSFFYHEKRGNIVSRLQRIFVSLRQKNCEIKYPHARRLSPNKSVPFLVLATIFIVHGYLYDTPEVSINGKGIYSMNSCECSANLSYSPELRKFLSPVKYSRFVFCTGNGKRAKARIIVLTMKRPESFLRLLNSLNGAKYFTDNVALDIWIDADDNNMIDVASLQLSRDFEWKQGVKTVYIRKEKGGLYHQWIWTWDETRDPDEFAVILEDDVEVSETFYSWLKQSRDLYANDENVAGFSLQRHTLIPKKTKKKVGDLHIPSFNQVYKYRLLGTWGFSPNRKQWISFRKWIQCKAMCKEKPYVQGFKTTEWYKAGEKDGFSPNMWSQWFIKFSMDMDYFVVTANLPENKTLARNWKENGLHFNSEKRQAKPDFAIYKGPAHFNMPSNPVHVDWDGQIIA